MTDTKRPLKTITWIMGGLCLLVIVLLVITGVRLTRNAAKVREPKRLAFGVWVPASEIDSNREVKTRKSLYIERAKTLREHWLVWAKKHKSSLVQMKQGTDKTRAFNAIYDALPNGPYDDDSGFGTGDLGGFDARIDGVAAAIHSNTQPPKFGWCLANKLPTPAAPDDKTKARDAKVWNDVEQSLHSDFGAYRDIRLLQSMGGGEVNISLWASGRITQDGWEHQDIVGQPGMVAAVPKEIVPPYDFVR